MLNLKAIRLQKGYSVPKFSELTGIHRRTIEDIEKRGDCKISTAYKFAQILGVTLEELYDEKTPDDHPLVFFYIFLILLNFFLKKA